MLLTVQVVGLAIPAVVPTLPKATGLQYCNLLVVVTLAVCLVLALFVEQRYRRRAASTCAAGGSRSLASVNPDG